MPSPATPISSHIFLSSGNDSLARSSSLSAASWLIVLRAKSVGEPAVRWRGFVGAKCCWREGATVMGLPELSITASAECVGVCECLSLPCTYAYEPLCTCARACVYTCVHERISKHIRVRLHIHVHNCAHLAWHVYACMRVCLLCAFACPCI